MASLLNHQVFLIINVEFAQQAITFLNHNFFSYLDFCFSISYIFTSHMFALSFYWLAEHLWKSYFFLEVLILLFFPRNFDREQQEHFRPYIYILHSSRTYVCYFWSTHDDVGTSISTVASETVTVAICNHNHRYSRVHARILRSCGCQDIEGVAIHRVRDERVVVLLVVVNSCRTSYRFDHASMLIATRRPLAMRQTENARWREREKKGKGKVEWNSEERKWKNQVKNIIMYFDTIAYLWMNDGISFK